MNFILMPSLEHRALVKIAIALWSRDELRDNITKSCLPEDKWQRIENYVAEKVYHLPIPQKLKDKLLTIIGPVGLRIKLWMEIHTDPEFMHPPIIQKFPATVFWTPHGTIDNKRTAEFLMKNETLDTYQRFSLACHYCMEDHIRDVWDKCNFRDCLRNRMIQNDLTKFWFSYLQKNVEFPSVHTFEDDFATYKRLFQYSAKSGNEVVTRYFCFKLSSQSTEEIRKVTAVTLALVPDRERQCVYTRPESISDVQCFLLSTMNADQQATILRQQTYEVLNSLLSWPWQSLFLETAKANLHLLSNQHYGYLLIKIVDRMREHNNLREIFVKFCRLNQERWQQFITKISNLGHLLLRLYKKNYKNNIKFILKEVYILTTEIGDQDNFRGCVGVTRFDSSGITFRSDSTEMEFKWGEILQLIEYCMYHKDTLRRPHVIFM